MVPLTIQEEMKLRMLGKYQDPIPKGIAFVRKCCVVLVCFKNMELLSFDSLSEIEVIRSFPTSTKVFVTVSAGNRIQGW